jgi:fatty acid desaturase
MRHADYVHVLRPLLPPDAFAPAPRKLIPAAGHLAIVLFGWFSFRLLDAIYWPVTAVIIGHSIACIGFLAHELSHGTIVRNRRVRYGLELLLWGLNVMPPTIWRRVHNETHHARTNTVGDPDRRLRRCERTRLGSLYMALFVPNRRFRYNPLCFLYFATYILRQTIGALRPSGAGRLPVNTAEPRFTSAERRRIAVEIAVIGALQLVAFALAGFSFTAYLLAGPVAVLVTSAVAMTYIFTNHYLHPLDDRGDIVAATTSVIVPGIFDRLHFNFSYHTEHHLFPLLNSDYFPLLSALLTEKFGTEYNRMPLPDAWSALWKADMFAAEAEPAGNATAPAKVQGGTGIPSAA